MFTIIIATHERPLLLHRTLQSLINQTYQNFTVIIASDSAMHLPPYQDLPALPGKYMYLLHNDTAGPALSRNMGLNLLNSEYVIFLDDDDTFESGHLQSLADVLLHSPHDILFTDFKIAEEDRNTFPPKRLKETPFSIANTTVDTIFIRNCIPNSSLVYSRKVVETIRYDPTMTLYEDWEFLLACLNKHELVHVPVNSVVIHKSYIEGDENRRRGNSSDEQIIPVMLDLYKRHPAKNIATKIARQNLFSGIGITLRIEDC